MNTELSHLVFDTNIFLKGVEFNLIPGIIYTTPSIIEEIKVKKYENKNRNILNRIQVAQDSKKLIIKSPLEKYSNIVENIAKKTGDFQILINAIPYQVNKATLISKVADLIQEKKIIGIKDIRDESSKGLIRIVIDLKKDTYPKKILNRLYSLTQLQSQSHLQG